MSQLKCDRCGKKYEPESIAALFGPSMYDGVICPTCGKFECRECKQPPFEAPCSWCHSPVEPAWEHIVKRVKNLP